MRCTVLAAGREAFRQSVYGLHLEENGLSGSLPEEMNDFKLDSLILFGNRLQGGLPAELLSAWERGPLQVVGYGELIGISKIAFEYRMHVTCVDERIVLRADGTATWIRERCRPDEPS